MGIVKINEKDTNNVLSKIMIIFVPTKKVLIFLPDIVCTLIVTKS